MGRNSVGCLQFCSEVNLFNGTDRFNSVPSKILVSM